MEEFHSTRDGWRVGGEVFEIEVAAGAVSLAANEALSEAGRGGEGGGRETWDECLRRHPLFGCPLINETSGVLLGSAHDQRDAEEDEG